METKKNTRIANPSILVRDAQSLTSRTARILAMLRNLCNTFILILVSHFIANSQEIKRNFCWAIGLEPVIKFDFNDTLKLETVLNYNMSVNPGCGIKSSGSAISDLQGNLVCFSNGFIVYDKDGFGVEDGTFINCPKGQILANFYGASSLFSQTSIILPKKGNRYYVFSTGMSDSAATNYLNFVKTEFDVLNYSVVDMDSNNGKGKVVDKNHLLLESQHYIDCALHSVRHGNGKDWWLVKADCENNRFQTFWVQEDTIYGPYYQNVPSNFAGDFCSFNSNIEFSPDGTQMASTMYGSIDIVGADTTYDFNRVDLFDFDRCSGSINYKQFYRKPFDTSSYPNRDYKEGICFSPDGNLLYMSSMYTLHQIDLQDTNRYNALLISGPDTIINKFPWYGLLKCAPNGKLYIGNQNGTRKYMSYIDKPNIKGLGCDFVANGVYQPYTNLLSPPNMPNYGLVSVSVGCEPAAVSQYENDEGFTVYPNPTSSHIDVKCEFTNNRNETIAMYNSIGQLVYSSTLERVQRGVFNIDMRPYPNGLYILKIGNFTKKIMKE